MLGYELHSWLSSAESTSAPCRGCDTCPNTHRISSWLLPCDPAKRMQILCPLKILQRERIRGCLSWRQLRGEGQQLTGISCEKQAKGYWSEPGTQTYLTLPHPLLAFLYEFFCCTLTLRVITTVKLHSCPSLLQSYSKPYLCQYGYCIHWNEVCFETKLFSGEVLSSFEREKQAWHQLSSL